MKRSEIIDLNNNLSSFDIRSGNKFFVFALEKNKATIKSILSEIDKKRDELIPASYVEFENSRMRLLAEYAERDESGKVIVEDGRVKLADSQKFSEKFSELKATYSSAISELEEADKKLAEFIKEDVAVEFAKVSFKFVPEIITSQQYDAIKFFIKETDEEILALGE
jgi:KaiC/GvpD/RAD55 family RecA-like ATPase